MKKIKSRLKKSNEYIRELQFEAFKDYQIDGDRCYLLEIIFSLNRQNIARTAISSPGGTFLYIKKSSKLFSFVKKKHMDRIYIRKIL